MHLVGGFVGKLEATRAYAARSSLSLANDQSYLSRLRKTALCYYIKVSFCYATRLNVGH